MDRTLAPTHPEALASGRDDRRVVGKAVQQGGGELFVATEDFRPLAEREVAGDEHGTTLVSVGDQVEEQLTACAIERNEANFVEDQELDT